MLPGRTTQALVQGITQVNLVTWPDLSPFINEANELVTEYCVNIPAAQTPPMSAYSDNRLQLIETNLAAHFYRSGPDNLTSSERADVVSQSLQHKVGFGFRYTPYGQAAVRLDTNGFLASLDNVTEVIELPKQGVGITYLGTPSPYFRSRW